MKDIIIFRFKEDVTVEYRDKIINDLEEVLKGTKYKPLCIFGDVDFYMNDDNKIIDFKISDLKDFIRDRKLKSLGI